MKVYLVFNLGFVLFVLAIGRYDLVPVILFVGLPSGVLLDFVMVRRFAHARGNHRVG